MRRCLLVVNNFFFLQFFSVCVCVNSREVVDIFCTAKTRKESTSLWLSWKCKLQLFVRACVCVCLSYWRKSNNKNPLVSLAEISIFDWLETSIKTTTRIIRYNSIDLSLSLALLVSPARLLCCSVSVLLIFIFCGRVFEIRMNIGQDFSLILCGCMSVF